MSDLFGAGPVPVSLSRSQAKGWVPTMSGICGPTSFASLTPAGPLASWENRLRERLATLGSTESPLIWEVVATPAGRLISRLRPWTPHKSGSGSTGPESDATRWPAPTAEDFARSDETIAKVQAIRLARAGQTTTPLYLGDVMRRVPWAAPTAVDSSMRGYQRAGDKIYLSLPGQMDERLSKPQDPATWPAVQANSAGNSSRSGDRKDELLLQGMMRENHEPAHWRGPTAGENRGGAYADPAKAEARMVSGHTINLEDQMVSAHERSTWRAPNVVDAKGGTRRTAVGQSMVQLTHQMADTSAMDRGGLTTVGSSATTRKPVGSPTPAFPCWLQGYPAVWLFCAPVKLSRPKKSPKRKRSAG